MIEYTKKVESFNYVDVTIPNGIHYGKIMLSDSAVYYKFIVREDEYDFIRLVNNKYRKSIGFGTEIATIWDMEKIFNNDSDTVFITHEEFNANYTDVLAFLSKINL